MAEKKKKSTKRIGHIAGKNPEKSINLGLTGSKYHGGGSKNKGKKGGIIRKPTAPIRYRRKSD
jgi:hypothetical protein